MNSYLLLEALSPAKIVSMEIQPFEQKNRKKDVNVFLKPEETQKLLAKEGKYPTSSELTKYEIDAERGNRRRRR